MDNIAEKRYCIAVWNFAWAGDDLVGRIEQFADAGFDTISLHPKQVMDADERGVADLSAVLARRGLGVTLHGNFDMAQDDARRLIDIFGERLLCFTFDSAMCSDSRGVHHDVARMAPLLGAIEKHTRGTRLRFGIEDFPLDRVALDHYRESLGELLAGDRFGMLVDIGHMNLRRRKDRYFQALSVQEYLRQLPLPLIEVHLHDNLGDKDSHHCFGQGDINFAAVAEGLGQISFDGVSTVEIAPSLHGSTPEADMPFALEALATWRRLWA